MKKLFITLAMTVICLAMNAQTIQRTFWGNTLGSSTYRQVQANLKNQGYTIETENTEMGPAIEIENVKYGGAKWEGVAFFFKNNQLYSVVFGSKIYSVNDDGLSSLYINFLTNLSEKYGEPEEDESEDEIDESWSDGQTLLTLLLSPEADELHVRMGLMYMDVSSMLEY